jgi:hypothetical protein
VVGVPKQVVGPVGVHLTRDQVTQDLKLWWQIGGTLDDLRDPLRTV